MTAPEVILSPTDSDHDVDLPRDAAPNSDQHSWLVSLSFWGTLLVAATIYASVALSPKFCVWNRVRLQQQQNAKRLSALESEVAYLERVEKALETDPEFRQQAAGSGSQTDTDSEFIPVSGNLLFGYQTSPAVTDHVLEEIPLYHLAARTIATDQQLRTILLTVTALLTFFAFAVLNDAGTSFVLAGQYAIRSAASWPFRRYLTTSEDQQNGTFSRDGLISTDNADHQAEDEDSPTVNQQTKVSS